MPNFTDLTGLASVASAIAASLLLLPGMKRLARPRLAMLQGAIFVVDADPVQRFAACRLCARRDRRFEHHHDGAAVVRVVGAVERMRMTASSTRQALSVLIALAAIALYPMALGVGAFDPYRLGYGDWAVRCVLLLVALAAWFRRYYADRAVHRVRDPCLGSRLVRVGQPVGLSA